jgi:hypothetical protein
LKNRQSAESWRIWHRSAGIPGGEIDDYLIPRRASNEGVQSEKAIVRRTLLETRNEQLREPGTMKFLREMHTPKGNATSKIQPLVDDGKSLSDGLRATREGDLSAIVQPYIQFVDARRRCSETACC